MLRNSVDLEELKNRRSFPKNNYFCYKWRIKDHFNRSIDRQIFHLRALGARAEGAPEEREATHGRAGRAA